MKKLGILLLVLSSIIFVGCGKEEEEKEIIKPVDIVETVVSKDTISKTFPGTVKGSTEARISFRVQGNLFSKKVGFGSKVEQGELLATLDPSDYEINYAEALANYAESEADVTRTYADFKRYKQLFLNDNASKAEYDNSKAAYKAAIARRRAIGETRDFAKLQLSYTKLKAPFTGTVSVEWADEGENLAAGMPIYTLIKEESPEVDIYIPENAADTIKLGDKVDITIDAIIGSTFQGVVTKVGSGVTGVGNTLPVEISITNPNPSIRSGMTAQVVTKLANPNAGRILLPLNTIVEGGDGVTKTVFVANKNDDKTFILEKRKVEVGNLLGDNIEITSGITAGEYVVTAGVTYLHDKQKVAVAKKVYYY